MKDNKIFLLLGEMEIDFAKNSLQYNDFILYAIYKLMSYWEKDINRKQEVNQIICLIEGQSEDKRIIAIKGAL